ncbi:cytochrome P450 76T24 isoform X2 [Arachis hypogaea]|uniref:cytochrome P450 76T24 isoform X2 n=1 Tax=Arachis hypogaea TaxID=3818 RepID=UPI0010FC63CA|nr:geraniol 8-hydroxylase isoform X2 [Arachis hypogaea]
MMIMEYLALLIVSFVSISIIIHHIFIKSKLGVRTPKSTKFPPGPKPLPIIGNILELGTQPHQALAKLSQTYGPIMTLKLGTITTIVISSPMLAKQILQKYDQIFSYRTIPDTVKALDHHLYSVGWLPPSTQWRILRRVCATKVFSPLKLDSTEVLRQKKLRELMDFVKDKTHYDSSKSQEFKDIIWGIGEESGRPNVVDFFPFLRFLDPQGARARMTKYTEKLIAFVDGLIEERLNLMALEMETTNKRGKDVLDSVLEVMLEDNSQVTRLHVVHLFLILFMAGVDSTSITIEWAMTELLRNPEKLEKLRKELQCVLGKGEQNHEQIEESHISKLPFLRAVVKETLRLHPPAPLLAPHKAHEDVEITGFMIPKNAQILVNVWAMGKDSSIWEHPNEFMPERFLDSKIDIHGHDFELIPFGAGRRICPGLPLGYRSVHIALATLLNGYDWKLANGQKSKDLDMSEKFGLTLHKAQPLQAIPIKSQ